MEQLHIWWVWIAAALIFGILELMIPGFILLGFAVGALAVGGFLLTGIQLSLPWLLVIFAVVSLLAWIGMRKAFGVRAGQSKTFDYDINEK